ncbi:calmodulin-binding protein 60 B isoform X2 [Arachis hypogaea]|uniref:calmodulin-binding protein 60 B isoform X2 n=1 Tax=Arachis hypogaea TaxID=3818 RepID=UPI0007AF43C5|nr:calmodulin-binding protein 60 G isoform X2 [Arachis hypogaea]
MALNKRASSCNEGNDERDLQVSLCKRKAVPDTRTASGISSTNDMAFLRESKFKRVLEQVIPSMLEQAIPPMLEKVIPPMLEQMIPPMLHRSLSSPCHGFLVKRKISPAAGGGRSLQLCLMKGLPSTIFTHINIRAEDSSTLQVAVCDATVQHSKVTMGDGPSLKVQLCVLRGDFEIEDWTAEEFNSNIESQREGKGPLLKGDTVITIENGVGFFKNVEFTDNSCWTRSGKFRIGVRVLHSNSPAVADIKEGRSEPIRVKDKRGVANQKPDRPSLDDKIAGKYWEKIIEHAKSCEIDKNERYIYQYFTRTAEQPKAISLLLNCIYEPVAISYDGQNFCSVECLDAEGKRCVETIKQDAYKNLNDLKPFEASSRNTGVVGEGQGHMVQPWAIGGGEQVGCSSKQLLYEAKWEEYMNPLQLDQFLINYPLNSDGGDYGAKSFD